MKISKEEIEKAAIAQGAFFGVEGDFFAKRVEYAERRLEPLITELSMEKARQARPVQSKIKNLPTEIFLNIGTDEEADFKQLREVTWAANRVHDSDIRYVLAVPQPEVMSLENVLSKYEAVVDVDYKHTVFLSSTVKEAMGEYASQFRTKADQLEAELSAVKEALTLISQLPEIDYEGFKNIRKAISIAKEALQQEPKKGGQGE